MIVDPASKRRFWSKVNKTDSCWIWTAAVRKGYGAFKFNGKVYDAHRFSYIIAYGDLDDDQVVCHTCDNPLCVRPDHFFSGTIADNNADMVAKGRHYGGANWIPGRKDSLQQYSTVSTTAKLTQEQADAIRQLHTMGYPIKLLAEQFGVARRTVQDIVTGRTW